MRKVLIIICLSLLILSCSNREQSRKKAKINQEEIRCDKFIVNTKLIDNNLTISLISDLPENTNIIVSISRLYWEIGKDDAYSIDYYKEKSNLKEWINKREIKLNNNEWTKKLKSHQKKMSELGSDFSFQIKNVSNNIEVSVIVPIKQSNPLFGTKNKNLVGKEVVQEGINTINKEQIINFPITGFKVKKEDNLHSKTSTSKENNLIGIWKDDSGSMQGNIYVYNNSGKIQVKTEWRSGSISRQTASIRVIGSAKRYYVSDSVDNEYFIINANGTMSWFDSYGLFEKYNKIR